MQVSSYYREQAERARRLARGIVGAETADMLLRVAVDYDEIAEDLEAGLVNIRHPELLPQNQR